MAEFRLYIPENKYGLRVGYYSLKEVVQLLRNFCHQPEVIYFIADMLEE